MDIHPGRHRHLHLHRGRRPGFLCTTGFRLRVIMKQVPVMPCIPGQVRSNCPCGASLHSGGRSSTSLLISPRRPFFLAWPLAKLNHPGTVKMQPLLFIRPLVRSTLPPSGSNAASCKPRRALAARTSPKQAIVSRVMVEEVRMDPGGLTSAISTLGRARRKGLRRQGNKFVP
jgi:hypothetical protein